MSTPNNITGVLLAGGQARRMGGGDKCLLPLQGKTLLQHTITRAQPQVEQLLLSANGNKLRFAHSKLQVVADTHADFPGPLAGIHAAMKWIQEHQPESQWLASFASDTPFLPNDLVTKLATAIADKESQIAVAVSEHRIQPVFALWHLSLISEIEETLKSGDIPKLQNWIKERNAVEVEFNETDYDPFLNINYPQDLYKAQDLFDQVPQRP